MNEKRSKILLIAAIVATAFAVGLPSAASAQPFGAYMVLSGPTDGYALIPSTAALNPASEITIEGWVNVTDPGGCSDIIGKNYQQAWWVGICGTTLRSYLKGTASLKDSGTLPAGQWTHFAVVYDGVTRKHYINGELIHTFADTGSLPATGDDLRIGSDIKYPHHSPHGTLNELRLWNVARTQEQIRATINVPLTTGLPGLVAVWHDGQHDSIGGHNGSLVGSVVFLTLPAALNCGTSTSTALCLNTRFSVTVTDRTGGPGSPESQAHVVGSNTTSGVFWFFSADNWELMVKSINGCGLNNRYWLFSAATTNVFYRMQVVDVHGVSKIYFNYPGPPAPAVTDTNAFATCP